MSEDINIFVVYLANQKHCNVILPHCVRGIHANHNEGFIDERDDIERRKGEWEGGKKLQNRILKIINYVKNVWSLTILCKGKFYTVPSIASLSFLFLSRTLRSLSSMDLR